MATDKVKGDKNNKYYKQGKKFDKNKHLMDLNERLALALETGQDPLGYLSITQIVEDIKTVNGMSEE